MFYYPNWLQTSPPVFLLLERGAVKLLGLSNWSLRSVPFAMGVASVVVTAILSRRLFCTPFALFCTALMALSPSAVEYSKELKQYSGDAASTAVILLVLWTYVERPNDRAFWRAACVYWLGMWFSHTVIMLVPLAVGVFLLVRPASGADSGASLGSHRKKALRCIVLVAPVVVLGALNYLFFIRFNVTPHLLEYWRSGYPQFTGLKGLVQFYGENVVGLPVFFFLSSGLKDRVLGLLAPPFAVWLVLGLVVCAAVIGVVIARFRNSSRHAHILLFCGLPVLTLVMFNLLHLYPVGTRRMMLFLLPCVAIGVTLLVESIWEGILAPMLRTQAQGVVRAAIAVFSLVSVTAGATMMDQWRPFQEEEEDVPSALRYLRENVNDGDLIYVHASLVESAKLDLKLLKWSKAPVLYGNTGWPCCIREEGRGTDRAEGEVQREMRELWSKGQGRTLWLLFTERSDHWREIDRNDPELMVNGLRQLGCLYKGPVMFSLVIVHQVACGP